MQGTYHGIKRPSIAVSIATGSFFALFLAPSITALDAGELGAASWELGVAHPPGFPVFVILDRFIMDIIPVGDVAVRGNFASAVLMMMTLSILAELGFRLGARWWACLLGALTLGLSPWLLLHGTTLEVYSGLGLWLVAMIWLTMRLLESKDLRFALLMSFCMGLGIGGHHPETRLFSLLFAGFILMCIRGRLRAILGCISVGLAGLLVVLYLPLRAATSPWRNWGDPVNSSRLWDHFWGARIRAAYADQMGVFRSDVAEQFGEQLLFGAPLLCALGVLGLFLIRRRPLGVLLVLIAITDFTYSLFVNPMGVRDLQNGVPLACVLGLAAMVAIQHLMVSLIPVWRIILVILIASLTTLSADWKEIDARANSYASTFLMDEWTDELAPEALALTASDTLSATFAYAQVVEGRRPDVANIVRQHVGYASSVNPVAKRCPVALEGWRPGAGLGALKMLKSDWPMGWEWSADLDAASRPSGLGPGFPLLIKPKKDPENQRPFISPPKPLASTDAIVYAGLFSDQGQARLSGILRGSALPFLEAALSLQPQAQHHWTNLGAGLAAENQFLKAYEMTEVAVHMAPNDVLARINLARYAIQLKRYNDAIETLNPVLDDQQGHSDGFALRGVARGNLGQLELAKRDFIAALKLKANQQEALMGLHRLERLSNEKSRAE